MYDFSLMSDQVVSALRLASIPCLTDARLLRLHPSLTDDHFPCPTGWGCLRVTSCVPCLSPPSYRRCILLCRRSLSMSDQVVSAYYFPINTWHLWWHHSRYYISPRRPSVHRSILVSVLSSSPNHSSLLVTVEASSPYISISRVQCVHLSIELIWRHTTHPLSISTFAKQTQSCSWHYVPNHH